MTGYGYTRLVALVLVPSLLAAYGCASPANGSATGIAREGAAPATAYLVKVTGAVRAPEGFTTRTETAAAGSAGATKAADTVASGSNLVAAGGGSLTTSQPFGLLAAGDALPQNWVSGATVQLVGSDEKVKQTVKSNADGRFTFSNVSRNNNYKVRVPMKQGSTNTYLYTFIRVDGQDVNVGVDVGTTMLGAAIAARFKAAGSSKLPTWGNASIDNAENKLVALEVVKFITPAKVPDLANQTQAEDRVKELATGNAFDDRLVRLVARTANSLSSDLEVLANTTNKTGNSVNNAVQNGTDAFNGLLNNLTKPSATPAATTTTTPATPSPSPSASPSASPTATPAG